MIGLTSFIAFVRIDDLTDYSKNHFELIDPHGYNAPLSIIENCNLVEATPLTNYNTFVACNGALAHVETDFIAENKQFVLLVSNSLPPIRRVELFTAINTYLSNSQSLKNFWNTSKIITFQNIKYVDYVYDLLPFCKSTEPKVLREAATIPGVEASSSSSSGPGPSDSSKSSSSSSSESTPADNSSSSSKSSKSSYGLTSLTSRSSKSSSSDSTHSTDTTSTSSEDSSSSNITSSSSPSRSLSSSTSSANDALHLFYANGRVRQIKPHGDLMYIAGYFDKVRGISRNNVAAFNVDSATITTYNPSLKGTNAGSSSLTNGPSILAVTNNSIYLAGLLTEWGDLNQAYVAKFDRTTGDLDTNWLVELASFGPQAMIAGKVSGVDAIFLTGGWMKINGSTVNSSVAVNQTNGAVLNYFATDGTVSLQTISAMAYNELSNTLYVGGSFVKLNSSARTGVASLTLPNTTTSLSISIDAPAVTDVLLSGSTIFFCGYYFKVINGQTRYKVAAINTAGTLLPFQVTVTSVYGDSNANVFTLAIAGNILYFGGRFDKVNGQKRIGIAAVNATTGELLPWVAHVGGLPNPDLVVDDIEVDKNNEVWIGGNFKTVNGRSRPYLAVVDGA